MSSRIALIHATPLAIEPVRDAFAQLWPAAKLSNLLEDSLGPDLATAGEITVGMNARFAALNKYAALCGADAILYTCSAFGPAIDGAKSLVRIPTLKPNEAMFEEALALAPPGGRVVLLTTFGPAGEPMAAEFKDLSSSSGKAVELLVHCVPDAFAALQAGDVNTHDRLLREAAEALGESHALMLGQFSMARAANDLAGVAKCPVLTSPGSAVKKLRQLLGQ